MAEAQKWYWKYRRMIVVLMGRAGSGKTSVLNYFKSHPDFGFHILLTTTTRPRRKHEVYGKEYYFVSQNNFQNHKHDYICVEEYDTFDANGKPAKWYYGLRKKGLDYFAIDNQIHMIILTPDGIKELQNYLNEYVFVLYLKASEETSFSRMSLRGDNSKEINRRLKADNAMFDEERLPHPLDIIYADADLNYAIKSTLAYILSISGNRL
jgi:guanylate kinase